MRRASHGPTGPSRGVRMVVLAAALALPASMAMADPQPIGAAAAGMRRLSDKSAGVRASSSRAAGAAEQPEALEAEPVQGPSGGMKLNLRGRFRSAVRRSVDGAGVSHQGCDGPSAKPE